ncbi:hypothetical protein [Streptomyces sp. NPDC046887]|uniref:hypothetical protein n=1 Tax=Streptomyces sp. NPDC046887 TaxID=3155472 RepID=UPI0034056E5F
MDDNPRHPGPDVLLARLAQRVGMRSQEIHLVAGLSVPDDGWQFDEEAGRELPRLVRGALSLTSSGRRRLREVALSRPALPPTAPVRERPWEDYPPGCGSLLVRMLALRNLGWSSGAKVMYLLSGVYLSPATIGAVGRGVRELDSELLRGFAAVLGIPLGTLEALTAVPGAASSGEPPAAAPCPRRTGRGAPPATYISPSVTRAVAARPPRV